jgi:hypothetical protein
MRKMLICKFLKPKTEAETKESPHGFNIYIAHKQTHSIRNHQPVRKREYKYDNFL